MTSLQGFVPIASVAATRHAAQTVAAVAFVLLLLGLGAGLLRARKRAERDEVERALESRFRRLERQFGAPTSPPEGES